MSKVSYLRTVKTGYRWSHEEHIPKYAPMIRTVEMYCHANIIMVVVSDNAIWWDVDDEYAIWVPNLL